MSVFVDKDIVGFDVSESRMSICEERKDTTKSIPMNEAQFMYSLDCKNTLRYIEPRHVFREGIILDEHGHQVASRKELHNEIQVRGILERVKELDHPRGIRLGEDVSFGTDMGKLTDERLNI